MLKKVKIYIVFDILPRIIPSCKLNFLRGYKRRNPIDSIGRLQVECAKTHDHFCPIGVCAVLHQFPIFANYFIVIQHSISFSSEMGLVRSSVEITIILLVPLKVVDI